MSNRPLARIFALGQPGADGVSVVAAASRARALGYLDLGETTRDEANAACGRLGGLGVSDFGVKASASDLEDFECPVDSTARVVAFWIAAASKRWNRRELERAIARARAKSCTIVAEVTTRAEARLAAEAGIDGLIVAGEEAGGWCGQESSFVLMQAVLAETALPVWVRGGVGCRVAAGCVAAGAAGVVLDGALLLARESAISAPWRSRIERCDGGDTSIIELGSGRGFRVLAMPGSAALARLRVASTAGDAAWEATVRTEVGWRETQCAPAGQDAAFAARLARKYVTTGGIIQAVETAIANGIETARTAGPLRQSSAMAKSIGARFPVFQGPMTRVSDVPEFAASVARGGGLPFVALAMLRGREAIAILRATAAQLGDKPWGVGILGFMAPELRAEQMAAVREVRPPFALIAGGRPDQAAGLESEGIRTFLHVPSPVLLDQYLREGCRRFVLEGRECGGHVGPRSSFVLWEQAIAVVEAAIERGVKADEIHLVFAGGIHDARSAAAVAGISGPLGQASVKIGVLAGTAYLFTKEAVESGAIVEAFQEQALNCRETVLLESGHGHQVRVSETPFVERFRAERARLLAEGRPADEVRDTLETLNVGRLRVATKGLDRSSENAGELRAVANDYQRSNGLYMLGQAATLRDTTTTIPELHAEICAASAEWIARPIAGVDRQDDETASARPSDVAIIGMAAVLPGAANVKRFWSNTLRGVDSVTEVPADRWDWRLYYDADPKAPDKIVSKWGGFVPDVAFDPLRFGMPPTSLPSIEPAQLLTLEVVRQAIADAGYSDRAFAREKTSVVLGMGGGAAQVAMGYAFRSYLPMLDTAAPGAGTAALEACRGLLPEWTEDSFPGFLLNVTAGRIANRLNLGGSNYTVDAACGSSLAAAALAVRELESGTADMVILGGVDTVQNPFTYLAFSKTQAFSPRGRCRPFDAGADGIVISEGVAAVILKRLADAERDGDRIYAVIKGVGSSSDGRARGLTAPVVDGQIRALDRAYAKSGISPASVGYVEAHGTGTALGDVVEASALSQVLARAGVNAGQCVVGSVKSLIGHAKCAAGLAGLINASLALHHRVLPPTIGIHAPNPKLDWKNGPLSLRTRATPWLGRDTQHPRRAGVSAFGFGGTNFHAVLEAYDRNLEPGPASGMPDWPVELLVWEMSDSAELLLELQRLISALEGGARPALKDLSNTLIKRRAAKRAKTTAGPAHTLAIIANDHDDLLAKVRSASAAISQGIEKIEDTHGIWYSARPEWKGAPVAFLFPGQGSQAPGMLQELAVVFPEVRGAFEDFNRTLGDLNGRDLGSLVFPAATFDDAGKDAARQSLRDTEAAQPAIGAACVGLLALMRQLGCQPDLLGGHSYGELVALHAAGTITADGLAHLSRTRGRLMKQAEQGRHGAMAAVLAGPHAAETLVNEVSGIQVANWNGPKQTVIAGLADAIDRALELAASRGIPVRRLPVACAFHTPMVAVAATPFEEQAVQFCIQPPDRPVYGNTDAQVHPADPLLIATRLGQHLARPVRFDEMIGRMHDDGGRVFVEVGPGSVLTSLVDSILGDRPHLAVSTDGGGATGLPAFLRMIARLMTAGVPLELERLTRGRSERVLDLENLRVAAGLEETHELTASTWLVNGSRSRPIDGPEPRRLGMGPVPPLNESVKQAESGNTAHVMADSINGKNKAWHEPAVAATNGHAREQGRATPTSGERVMPRHAVAGPVAQNGNGKKDSLMSAITNTGRNGGGDRVMESFQATMQAFLEVQKATMLAYLGAQAKGNAAGSTTHDKFGPGSHGAEENGSFGGRLFGADRSSGSGAAHGRASQSGSEFEHSRVPATVRSRTDVSTAATRIHEPATAKNGKHASDARAPVVSTAPELTKPVTATVKLATGVVDRATVTARLLEVVKDRTGYPLETLGLDLDIEADLGIDSIKRVEILGRMRDEFPSLRATTDTAAAMDELARARTLGMIVERMVSRAERGPASGSPADDRQIIAEVAGTRSTDDREMVSLARPERRVLEVVAAPLSSQRLGLMAGGRVLVTDDGRGFAKEIAGRLESAGIGSNLVGGNGTSVDWASPASVTAMVERARERGPLAGVIHALPLGQTVTSQGDWPDRMNAAVKGLFLVAKAAATDLDTAAKRGGACLVAATALGGRFGCAEGDSRDFFAGHGGVLGLLKTLAREWPAVRCRAVDLPNDDSPELVASRIIDEAMARDGWSEVGYDRGQRVRVRSLEQPLDRSISQFELRPGAPVLITGGARGITALGALELARTWRPTLLIIGTTPEATASDAPDLEGLTSDAEIKSAWHARLRDQGRAGTAVEIEQAYRGWKRQREVRDNLAQMRALGATVEYAAVDVRDRHALAAVLEAWRTQHGDPVGLIHGAGMIRDKLIQDKSIASFDDVLGTKLDGALNLIGLLRPEALEFTVLYSSIAGRYGNVGQTDYAAANESLSKLAQWLDARSRGRVVSLIWGPWSGVGMVSELEGHLGRRGLSMIAPELGRSLLVDELRYGKKGDVEVIYTGGLGTLECPLFTDAEGADAGESAR